MDIRNITVVGAGLMGHGIAQVCAAAGFPVMLVDINDEVLGRALGRIDSSLARLVKAGKLDEAGAAAIKERITTTTDLKAGASGADLIIEAVPERLELKRELFAELDRLAPAQAILATNTSELSVTAIAAATGRPEKVVGMHWFNPPVLMRLIEIVNGVDTSPQTTAAIQTLSARLGKETVVVQDRQGFITTRALGAFLAECVRMLEEGVAAPEDIDKAIKLGLNHPMGPLELADYTGLDTIAFVCEGLTHAYGDRFRAPQTLVKLVEAGHLGRKTGRGFYTYEKAT